jgi:hypothetical protein
MTLKSRQTCCMVNLSLLVQSFCFDIEKSIHYGLEFIIEQQQDNKNDI